MLQLYNYCTKKVTVIIALIQLFEKLSQILKRLFALDLYFLSKQSMIEIIIDSLFLFDMCFLS
jgi:hypothetical protein